jgi:osmotically-inducible protein OsmY
MSALGRRQACTFALALVLLSSLPGRATVGKCDSDSCLDDENITTNILAELDEYRGVDSTAIRVQTHHHVVCLYGQVASGL